MPGQQDIRPDQSGNLPGQLGNEPGNESSPDDTDRSDLKGKSPGGIDGSSEFDNSDQDMKKNKSERVEARAPEGEKNSFAKKESR